MESLKGVGVPSAVVARQAAAKAKTQADRAYLQVKADIIDCILPPGELLSTQQLIAHTGMGMSAIRAAMERLVAGHWVEPVANKGYRIDGITLKDVIELYDLSETISPRLARLSSGRIGPIHERLMELHAIAFGESAPTSAEEEQRVLLASGEILREIRVASGNSYAIAFTQQITERLDRVVAGRRNYATTPIDFRRDFRPLIEALANNDPDAAESASLANVRQMRTLVIDNILRLPQFSGSAIHGRRTGATN